MFSYFRTVYGSRWIGFDGFFLHKKRWKKHEKTWCLFFLGGGNTLLVVNKPFGNTFFGVLFFVETCGFWAALKCVFFLGSGLM